MPEHHTRQGYACTQTGASCKQMVFNEIWRFPIFPSLEDPQSSNVLICCYTVFSVDTTLSDY